MESWIHRHAGSDPSHADDAAEPTRTRAFFERIRERLMPRMAPALRIDDAEVGYLGRKGLALWGLRSRQGLVLAYECADTPALLAERARRWLGCLRTRTAPGMLDRTWGRPVYGARLDTAWDSIEVVWAKPGEWCGLVLSDEPAQPEWALPSYWTNEPEFQRS